MAGRRIDANFTEDTVAFAPESFLSVLSFPLYRFSIEPFSHNRPANKPLTFSRCKEHLLGADARLRSTIAGFRSFYMQFKHPMAYSDDGATKVIKDR